MEETTMDFRRFDTITFDCYGTLIDWERGLVAALAPILERHGRAVEGEELLALFGRLEPEVEAEGYRRYREVLAEVLRRLGRELGFAPTDGELARFGASVADWPPFADSAGALARLARRFRLVVVSNVDDDLFAASAARLGNPFDRAITAEQVGAYKPDPAVFRHAIAELGGAPERILHVAQSLFHDVAPARAHGLATVWINRRVGKQGPGATPPSGAAPDLELPDLASLADRLVD